MRNILILLVTTIFIIACKPEIQKEYITTPCPEEAEQSISDLKAQLKSDGFQIFDYIDPDSGDTVVMQQYFMVKRL